MRTIGEAKDTKCFLEAAIKELLNGFIEDTRLSIDKIRISHVLGKDEIENISIEVHL